ncbi:MAG: hypothetical protein RMX65_009440 [Nostoc sp. DedQUE01]|nr:hypothetical protein [Nostoc sp. DedQUE11]MDZ8076168.1 hypothetical protein [Nostoc sp. DedQUE01]
MALVRAESDSQTALTKAQPVTNLVWECQPLLLQRRYANGEF